LKPDNLTDLWIQTKRYYEGMYGAMHRANRLYNREFSGLIEVPAGVTIHESSTPTLIVDSLRDQIRVDEPKVTFDPRGTSIKARKHKNLMELWGQHIMEGLALHSIVDPIGQAVFDLLLRGAACIKCVVDNDLVPVPPISVDYSTRVSYLTALDEYETRLARYWPWVCKAVDPLNIALAPGSRRPPQFVIERQVRRAGQIADDYSWADPRRRHPDYSPMREVEWLEYWDADSYVVEVDGVRIIDRPNPYGLPSYIYSYSGMGRADADGDPVHLAISILSTVAGELEEEVRIKTAQAAQWLYYVFPILLTRGLPATVRQQMMSGPGAIIQVSEGMAERPQWLEVPPPTPSMNEFLRAIQQSIFRKVSPALLERPTGVDYGIHQALLIGQALKVITPIRTALDRMGTDLINLMAKQMSTMHMRMTVMGTTEKGEREYTVGPEDFTNLNFHVTYEATDPAENDRRMLTGLSVLRVPGLMSRETWRDRFAKAVIPDPEAEEAKILAEQAIDQFVASGGLLQLIQQQVGEEQVAQAQGQVGERLRAGAEQELSRGQALTAEAGIPEELTEAGAVTAEGALAQAGIAAAEGQRGI
jgi:hypothetical protein